MGRHQAVILNAPGAWDSKAENFSKQVKPYAGRVGRTIKIGWRAAGGNTYALTSAMTFWDGQTLAVFTFPNSTMITNLDYDRKVAPVSLKIKCIAGKLYYCRNGIASILCDYLAADRASELAVEFRETDYYTFMSDADCTAFIYPIY